MSDTNRYPPDPADRHGLLAPASDCFRLDRGVLADSLHAEGDADEGCGLQHFGETPAEQIAGAVQHAELEKALHIPESVDLDVLKLPLSTIIRIPHLRSRFFPRLVERGAELF